MLTASVDVAKALGIKGAKIECTGSFSRKGAESCGFELVAEQDYAKAEYKGAKMFPDLDTKTHPSCTLMIKVDNYDNIGATVAFEIEISRKDDNFIEEKRGYKIE